MGADETYRALSVGEAVAVLVEAAGIEADDDAARAIAALVGCERPALRWAGGIARTIGWRPLRERLTHWASLPALDRHAAVPWREHVESVQSALDSADRALLEAVIACDVPFTWDVLEAVTPDASIDAICRLEHVGLLVRSTCAGVVAFAAPYCVRAVARLADPEGTSASSARWLAAWAARAEQLRSSTYGPSARATLAELAFAVPLAARALLEDGAGVQERAALALWTRATDAAFFAQAIDFASPAFARAVAVADATSDPDVEVRVRTRIAAARALLEEGEPSRAEALLDSALSLADRARDDLRSEALRGLGWTRLASAQLEQARASFESAAGLLDPAADPRGHADALAGLGIFSLLTGEPETARERLEDAIAVHVLMRDAPREASVRGMMALLPDRLETPVDESALAKEIESLRASGQGWRQALALARLGLAARSRGDHGSERAHLGLARAAAGLSKMPASSLVASLVASSGTPARATPAIVVGVDGRSLRIHDGDVHDLTRHGPVRRVLHALTAAHSERAGVALSTLDLVDAGWPGEKMKHEAATLRVYTTVRRLRALGLSDVLLTRDDGYLFDPEVAISLERA